MITATVSPDFAALAKRLAARAARLAEAKAESDALSSRGNPLRWRKARLLWPLITEG